MLRDLCGWGAIAPGGAVWVCLLRGWTTAAAVLCVAQWMCLVLHIGTNIRRDSRAR
jgi:hypothetical protein